MFNDINGMKVFLEEMLGQCHGPPRLVVARGDGSAPSAMCLLYGKGVRPLPIQNMVRAETCAVKQFIVDNRNKLWMTSKLHQD
jgi:hypothetical protein